MYGMQLLQSVAVTLALLGNVHCLTPLSGKCRTDDLKPVSLDGLPIRGTWNIQYISNTDVITDLDRALNVVTATGDNTYNLAEVKILSNNRTFTRNYLLTIEGNILNLQYLGGKGRQFKAYPLARTNENAILLYLCSDKGKLPIDVRTIAIHDDLTLADDSLQQLFNADESYNFKGNLYKLPNKLK